MVPSRCECEFPDLFPVIRRKQFYPAEDGVLTLLCGPGGLIEKAAIPGLEKMGFEKCKNVFGY